MVKNVKKQVLEPLSANVPLKKSQPFKHFLRFWSTCGSLKNCCNFQWVLVVVRDVEKESGIESEGWQKKANFFQKTRFCIYKNCKNCVRRACCACCVCYVRCVRCVRYGFSGLHLFFPVVGVLGWVCSWSFCCDSRQTSSVRSVQ